MPNPLSQFIQNRFIQPAVNAQVERALSDKQPVVYGASAVPEVSLAQAIGQPHDTNYSLLYSLYKLNTDVSGCVHKWAGGVTGPGWRITTMDPDAKITTKLDNQMTDIARWLANPNPHKLIESMLYELVQHFGIVGDAFWYISADANGIPLEIWPMHPALTKIVASKQGEVLGYVMKSPGEEPVAFATDEVLHFPLPNPTNDLYGESPLELVVEEAGIDLSALRSNKAIFQNGMNPSAVLLMDENATPQQAKDVTDQLKQAHTGAANQHKLLAVARVKDYKPSTMSPRDLEFLKLRDLATSKVTTAYRIPKVLLGYHNAGDYATTKFLIRDTYEHVYQPMQHIISAIITERLIHRFNPELRFELLSPKTTDPDDIRKDSITAETAGILTADEVRSTSFALAPLPKEIADNQPPPVQPDTPTAQDQQPDTDAADTAQEAPKTGKTLTKALSEDQATRLANQREAELDELAEPLIPAVAQFFTGQEQDFLNRLDDALSTRTLSTFLAANADVHDTQLHMLLFGLLVASLTAGSNAAQLQLSISLTFDQTNPLVQDYLQTQALAHAQGINQTTREAIKEQLSEGLKNGEGVDDLAKRIQSVFTDAKGYRAQLIARNETAQAYQYGNLQSAKATGLDLRRIWITSEDERVCVICSPMNGKTAPLDDSYPGGLEPSEAHVSCRCSEYYELLDGEAE